MEKRDKRGLTEAEYLAQYKPGRYPQPSLTVDIILLAHAEDALRVLLVRRGGHPYLGCWALPGGFAEPQETTAQAAVRELAEETGCSARRGATRAAGRSPTLSLRWRMRQRWTSTPMTMPRTRAGSISIQRNAKDWLTLR